MASPGPISLDVSQPDMRRIHDYWLGGKDNFAADREAAQRIEEACGPLPAGQVSVPRRNARTNRAFLERAVRFAAGQGAGQFAQLAAGLPAPRHYTPLHDMARAIVPGARFAYADGDPATVSLTRALTDGQDVDVIEGHLGEPEAVLKLLADVIDLDRPVCLIIGFVLHLMDAGSARAVTASYISALAPGSFLILTCPVCNDPELRQRLAPACASETWNHGVQDIRSFFAGTELIEPGLVPARAWRPPHPEGMTPPSGAYVLGGVGRK